MNQSILEKIFNKIPPIDDMKRYVCQLKYKGNFKKLIQQKNHETDSCKKDLPNTLRRKGE